MRLTPYLTFDGNCEEAFRFYERVLGGKIEMMMDHGSSPIAGQVPETWHKRVMHARLVVGDAMLMASDVPPDKYAEPKGVHVAINVEDPAVADRIFTALAEGGRVTMPIEKTFWAERFGILVDRFGISWFINGGQRD